MKKKFTIFISLLLSFLTFYAYFEGNVNAAAVSNITITGTGIAASSANINTAITPTVGWITTTNLNADGEFIRVKLNGISVAAAQTLTIGDLTFSGCSSNTLEAFPGIADNGAHEVSISNGSAGNDNPTVVITLDNSIGPLAPSCPAGNMNLSMAAGQLVSHDSVAGNYVINIVTSSDEGGAFFYVASENNVTIRAVYNPQLGFTVRNETDTADLATTGASGPYVCDLGRLNLTTLSTCSYRLKVSTNAPNGYYITSSVDDDLNNFEDTAFINNTPTGSSPASPNEGYNIILSAGSSTDGVLTECDGTAFANCLGDGIEWNNPVGIIFNNITDSVIFTSDGPNAPNSTDLVNTSLITHRAIADQTTLTGTYNQLVTYTLVPVF